MTNNQKATNAYIAQKNALTKMIRKSSQGTNREANIIRQILEARYQIKKDGLNKESNEEDFQGSFLQDLEQNLHNQLSKYFDEKGTVTETLGTTKSGVKINENFIEKKRMDLYKKVLADFKDKEKLHKNYVSRLYNDLGVVVNSLSDVKEKTFNDAKNELELVQTKLQQYLNKKNEFWTTKNNSTYVEKKDHSNLFMLMVKARAAIDYTNKYVMLGHIGEYAVQTALTGIEDLENREIKNLLNQLRGEGTKLKAKVISNDTVYRATRIYGDSKWEYATQATQDKVDVELKITDGKDNTNTLGLSVKNYEYANDIGILSGNGYSIMSIYPNFLKHLTNLLQSNLYDNRQADIYKTYRYIKATIGLHALIGYFMKRNDEGVVRTHGADYFVVINRHGSVKEHNFFEVYSTASLGKAILDNLTNNNNGYDLSGDLITLSKSATTQATANKIMSSMEKGLKNNQIHSEYKTRFADIEVMLHLKHYRNQLMKNQ